MKRLIGYLFRCDWCLQPIDPLNKRHVCYMEETTR